MPLSEFNDVTLRNVLEKFCDTAFNSILITTSENGYPIVYANPAFCKMTGYGLEELKGRSPKLFQGEKTNPLMLERLKKTVEDGELFYGSTVNYKKDGTPYPVEWNISAIYDEQGSISHYISIQKDLSDLKSIVSMLKHTNENFRQFLLDISRPENVEKNRRIDQNELVSDVLKNCRLYNSALRTDENIEIFGETEFYDCNHGLNGMLANEMPQHKMSAKEYIHQYGSGLDIQELESRIRETQEKIELLAYSKNTSIEMADIGQNIQDVANDIFYFEDFVSLSSVLTELASNTKARAHEPVDDLIINTYRALLTDLEVWLRVNFIEQTTADIHALDASTISSAKQLLHFLR